MGRQILWATKIYAGVLTIFVIECFVKVSSDKQPYHFVLKLKCIRILCDKISKQNF